jgi:hypothetical protein
VTAAWGLPDMGMMPSHGLRFPGLSAVGQSAAALAAGLADPAAQAAALAALGYQHGARSNEITDSLASLHYQLGLAAKSWGIKAATVVNQAVSATAGVGQKTVTTTGNAFAPANVGDQFSLQGAGAAYADASGAFPLVSTIVTKTDSNNLILADDVVTTVASKTAVFGPDNAAALQNAVLAGHDDYHPYSSVYQEGAATPQPHKLRYTRLWMPPGFFFCKDLSLTQGFHLRGWHRGTRLLPCKGATRILGVNQGPSAGYWNYQNKHPGFIIEDIMFDGLGRGVQCDALQITRADHFMLRGVVAEEFDGTALDFFESCREAHLFGIISRACGNASKPSVNLDGRGTLEGHNQLFFFGLQVAYSCGDAVKLETTAASTRTRSIFFDGSFLHGPDVTLYGDATLGAAGRAMSIGNAQNISMMGGRINAWGKNTEGAVTFEANSATQHTFTNVNFGTRRTGGSPTEPACYKWVSGSTAFLSLAGHTQDNTEDCVHLGNASGGRCYIDPYGAKDNLGGVFGPSAVGGDRCIIAGTAQGTGAPTTLVPDFIRQTYYDRTNSKLYVATGLSAGNWVILN